MRYSTFHHFVGTSLLLSFVLSSAGFAQTDTGQKLPAQPQNEATTQLPMQVGVVQSHPMPPPGLRKPPTGRSRMPGVQTAAGSGRQILPGTLAFAAGNFDTPEGVAAEVWNRAALYGGDYAFIQLDGRIDAAVFSELHRLGVRTWAVFPHQAIQAYVPHAALPHLAGHARVRWIGTAPPKFKFHPNLSAQLKQADPMDTVPIWISLIGEETAGGKFQRELENRGFEVHFYRPSTRTFAATGPAVQIAALAQTTWVHFLSPQARPTLMGDTAAAMVGQDSVRNTYDGDGLDVAMIDSGYWSVHQDLTTNAIGFDTTGLGPFTDGTGHGTHVAGTFWGAGVAQARFKGMVPGVSNVVIGRYFDDSGNPVGDVNTLYTDIGANSDAVLVNCSWGTDPLASAWIGTEQEAIDVDNAVWDYSQAYVFAAGNAGASGIALPAVAKNALAVGSITDYESTQGANDLGDLSATSATGGAGDNRLKPEVVAPGSWVTSTSHLSASGYEARDGTSSAAAHVSGMLASAIDHFPFLFDANPKLMRSWAMATALKKGGDPTVSNTTGYGFGIVNAQRLHDSYVNQWLGSWVPGTAINDTGVWGQWNLNVPANTSRLTVVLCWDEPGVGTTGGATPVTSTVEMYLDYFNDQPGGNQGDVVSAESGNYQFFVIENPPAGLHAVKFWPVDTDYDNNGSSDDLFVAASMIMDFDDVRPTHTLEVSADPPGMPPGGTTTVTAEIMSGSHIALATMLNIAALPNALQLVDTEVTLADGTVIQYGPGKRAVPLGAIRGGEMRTVRYTFSGSFEGTYPLVFESNNDNGPQVFGHTESFPFEIYIDGVEPEVVTNLTSSTHPSGVWLNNNQVSYQWTPAVDDRAGVNGYGVQTQGTPGLPSADKDIEDVSSYTETLADGEWYFNIRTQDRASNWDSDFASYGPVQIDTLPPDLPTGLDSTSHNVDKWSNLDTIDFVWTGSTDLGSQIDGYSLLLDADAQLSPDTSKDIEEVQDYSATVTEGNWFLKLRPLDNAGNWSNDFVASGRYLIDLTEPLLATNLTSSTHPVGVWVSDTFVRMNWDSATDALSGLEGYSFEFANTPTLPDTVQDLNQFAVSQNQTLSDGIWYFNLRSQDKADNWSAGFEQYGPIQIDITKPSLVDNLDSATHPAFEWQNDPNVVLTWTQAPDSGSGVDGYSIELDMNQGNQPDTVKDIEEGTSYSATLAEGNSFFRIRTVDNAGLWANGYKEYGPMRLDITEPGTVSNLRSTSHATSTWRNDQDITFEWDSATDALSGVDGYSLEVASSPVTPDEMQDIGALNLVILNVPEGMNYLSMRTVDQAGNWDADSSSTGPYWIDITEPDIVTNLGSTTHTAGVWTSATNADFQWTAANDALSGVAGYSVLVDPAGTLPNTTPNLSAVTAYSTTINEGIWYMNIRSVDAAGNWDGDFESFGPIQVDTTAPDNLTVDADGGSPYTLDALVDLTVSATDALSGVAEMRFSNDGTTWSNWEPYNTQKTDWDLTLFGGNANTSTNHVIWAQFRDAVQNVSLRAFDNLYWAVNTELDKLNISRSLGGTVNFGLYCGVENAGKEYLLLGTVSGTVPGTDLPRTGGGTIHVDLNFDSFTTDIQNNLNNAVYSDFLGTLDSFGRSLNASYNPPAGSLPGAWVGRTMHFAVLVQDPAGSGNYSFAGSPGAINVTP